MTSPRGDRLRALFITGAYFPEISSGGLQAQMMARTMTGLVDVAVLTTAVDPALPRQAVVDGVPVSRIVIDVNSIPSKLRAADEMIRDLVALLRRSDVVHVQGFSQKNVVVTALAKALRVPIVLSLQTAGFDEPDTVARQGRLARWAFRAAAVYLCVSPLLAESCRRAGVPPDRIRFVPNGVDVDRFRPARPDERAAARTALGIAPGRPVILFVGFFSHDKQPHVLFDAWLRLQRDPATASTLVLVGAMRSAYFEVDERLADDIRSRAEREGVADRVLFVAPTHRIEEYYRAADVFALPSIREGMPIALLEGMASGLAAVASRLPGSTDAVIDDDRTGVLVAPGDAEAFAGAIRGLLIHPARAAALGAAARQRAVADFGADRIAAQWVAAYRDVIAAVS